MNSLKKGKGVSLLNFVRGPGVPLLNFEGASGVQLLNFGGSRVPLVNFEGGPVSHVLGSQGPGYRGPGPNVTPCRFIQFSTRMVGWILQNFLICLHNQLSSIIHFIIMY